ncbi:MAG: hypothetical protein NTZ67_06215 [Gammaproteobacteria bacterium]|nr:hypothetical protein [Gammaproteobacteria bacterium]
MLNSTERSYIYYFSMLLLALGFVPSATVAGMALINAFTSLENDYARGAKVAAPASVVGAIGASALTLFASKCCGNSETHIRKIPAITTFALAAAIATFSCSDIGNSDHHLSDDWLKMLAPALGFITVALPLMMISSIYLSCCHAATRENQHEMATQQHEPA